MADNTLIERGTYRARTSTEGTRELYTRARAALAPGTAHRRRRAARADREKADTQQIKAFVLCTDVSEENEPLKVMDADDSRTLRKTLGYHFRDRVTDEEAERAMGPPQYASWSVRRAPCASPTRAAASATAVA